MLSPSLVRVALEGERVCLEIAARNRGIALVDSWLSCGVADDPMEVLRASAYLGGVPGHDARIAFATAEMSRAVRDTPGGKLVPRLACHMLEGRACQ